MMLPFFLLILLGLSWVDTTVNNTNGLDNSTSALDTVIEPRAYGITCRTCGLSNTFSCTQSTDCQLPKKYCYTVAIRVSPREIHVLKDCTETCTFLTLKVRRLPKTNSLYMSMCCWSNLCNDPAIVNLEKDLLPESTIEEETIARAVCMEEFNLLLSLGLILSSSILI